LFTICVINGTAAGGGYELALAADHIMLVDDGSSAVSLPELPLLAVLPGTGGLTRVTDKRKVRRDRADVFCTTEGGIKGKRAVDWRLVRAGGPGPQPPAGGGRAARGFAAQARPPERDSASPRPGAAGPPPGSSTARSPSNLSGPPGWRTLRGAVRTRRHPPPPRPWPIRARSSGRSSSRASSTMRSSTSAPTN